MRTSTLLPAWTLALVLPGQLPAQAEVRDLAGVVGTSIRCQDREVGTLRDLIVELDTGQISHAVVALRGASSEDAERLVAIPYDDFDRDAGHDCLRLASTAEQLRAVETLEPQTFVPAALPQKPPKTTEAATGSQADAPTERFVALGGFLPATQLASCRLRLRGEADEIPAGKATEATKSRDRVHGLAVELTTGVVAFATAPHNRGRAGDAQLHPVPWSACQVVALRPAADKAADKIPTPILQLSITRATLSRAPAMTEILLRDPLYRARVYKHFGLSLPPFETDQ